MSQIIDIRTKNTQKREENNNEIQRKVVADDEEEVKKNIETLIKNLCSNSRIILKQKTENLLDVRDVIFAGEYKLMLLAFGNLKRAIRD